ncbi:MAG: ABC transporter substrate-binding protein [Alphaproteobacteria bacterium]|nr:ABC transporter substrate-binding protein [Alphaproteobacteria bacterium]
MKKILIGLLIVICISAIGYNAYQSEKQKVVGKRTVYAVLPLTGPIGQCGQLQQRAMQLYQKQHPNASYDVVYIDGQFQGSLSLTALQQKVIGEEKPLVVTAGTVVGNAIVPFVEKQNGFTVFIGGAHSKSLDAYHNYLVFSVLNGEEMKNVADYISNHYSNAGVFYANSEYGILNRDIFKTNLKEEIDFIQEEYDEKNADVRIIVQKILEKNPESIVVVGAAVPAFLNIFRELKRQNYTGQIFTGITFGQDFVLNALGDVSENVIFMTMDAHLDDPQTEAGRKFRKFAQENNLYPSWVAIEGYATSALIDDMISKNIEFTQENFLKIKEFDDISGKFKFTKLGDTSYPYVMAIIKEGKILPVQESKK